jgi:DNA-binding NtrC family response regulator
MKVLVIDDDAGVRQTLRAVLEDAGYSIASASDAEDGLAQALTDDPGFIIYDASMPGLDATEFMGRYSESGGQALVIVTVVYGDNAQALKAMENGAYDTLPKPFTASELLLTLRKAVLREAGRGGRPQTPN